MAQIKNGQVKLQVNVLLSGCDDIFEMKKPSGTVSDEELVQFIAEELENRVDIESVVIAGQEYSVSPNERYHVTKVNASA